MSFRKHIESTPHRCLIVITPYELLEFVVVVVVVVFCFCFCVCVCVCVCCCCFLGGRGGGGGFSHKIFLLYFLISCIQGFFFLSLPLFPYVFVKPWW